MNSICLKDSFGQESNKGELSNLAKVLLDSFLEEDDNKFLDYKESVIAMNFESIKKEGILTINDESIEQYADLETIIHTKYRSFNIVVKGVPDDIFFLTDANKKRLKRELRKKKNMNSKMYDKIDQGKNKEDVVIYSEYDPQVYYHIYYVNNNITKTVPEYLLKRIGL
jgi:hypothetical protein